ncbi:hypothetical protein V6N13_078727 [Hibiscus sabdariffa]
MDNAFYVDPVGIAGGLALWWTNDVKLSVLLHDKNLIDTVISINGEDEWFGTFIYAPPYEEEKQEFWESLGTLRDDINAKWCIMGDTNIVASPNEKYGGTPFDHNNTKWFHEFLQRSYLMEIQSKGGAYTWSNQRCEENEICEKLDRVMSSVEWSFLFPKAIAIIEIHVASDHAPIVLLTTGMKKKVRSEFKFESRWTLEEECSNIVQEEWVPTEQRNHRGTFRVKLRRTKVKLWNWNREKFGKNKTSANDIANKIKALHSGPMTRESAVKLKDLKAELSKLWESEEMYWQQRSRIDWLKSGDRNSKFFHATTLQNRRQNNICRIQSAHGEWLEDDNEIAKLFQEHYKTVYMKSPSIDFDSITNIIPRLVTKEMNEILCKQVSKEEVKEAVFNMGSLKAPGPDGFPGTFYRTYWEFVKEDLFIMVESFFSSGVIEPGINRTNIVLIPKCKNPCTVKNFRPISLCNFSLKVITKILATRLKAVLPGIIPCYQSAFVKGRLIHDNIIIAYEAFHAIKRRTRSKDSAMAIKIDLEKAYDKVDWDVLRIVMEKMGFAEKEINCHRYDGLRIRRSCPTISHILFADGCILFSKADEVNCRSVRRLLEEFQNVTGQTVNWDKSSVFFSPNCSDGKRAHLSNILNFGPMEEDSSYLGLPSIWGKNKKKALSFIKDKVRRKLQGWKTKLLNQAGKEVLIKVVVQAIPSYVMQCFLLPVTFCDELCSLITRFWWYNSKEKERGIHWLNWRKLCKPKDQGGLGFRDLRTFNKALIAKVAWRLIKFPDSLLARTLMGIYFPDGDIFASSKGNNPSWAWTSIKEGIKDKWIPQLPSLSVSSPKPPLCTDVTVSRLILPDERRWNLGKLESLFSTEEVEAIISVPIGGEDTKDELIWSGSRNGQYSVKSGYYILSVNDIEEEVPGHSEDTLRNRPLWKSLWKLKVPPKIRAFLWKLCHNILPTRGVLSNQFHGAFSSSPACSRCGENFECSEHCLFFCPFAQAVWRASGFNYTPDPIGFPGFAKWWSDLLFHPVNKIMSLHCELLAFLCWHIWKVRNNFLFSGCIESPIEVWQKAERPAAEFAQIWDEPNKENAHQELPRASWTPPINGYVKINCDASVSQEPQAATTAAILRDSDGRIVGGEARLIHTKSVDVAEAMAIRLGVETAAKAGFTQIMVESDNLNLINRIVSKDHSFWKTAAVEKDIVALSCKFTSCSFSFISRKCNMTADWVAKNFRVSACPSD